MNKPTDKLCPDKPKLVDKFSRCSSRGFLSKAWYMVNNDLILVKGNSKGGYEPYSEVIAHLVAKCIGIETLPYWLESAGRYPDIKVFGIEHVSVCWNFLSSKEKYISINNKAQRDLKGDPMDWLGYCKHILGEQYMDKMFLIDAIVGNEDRHLNNFGLIETTDGVIRPSPIFDIGASLLSWVEDLELSRKCRKYVYDRGKPLRTEHKRQLQLFKKPHLRPSSKEEIFTCIGDILSCLDKERSAAIKTYLSWRLEEYLWK